MGPPTTVIKWRLHRTQPVICCRASLERGTEALPSNSARNYQYPRHSEYEPATYQRQYQDDLDADDDPEEQ